MKKKRILIFSTAYFPFVGGAEVAMKEITDRIDGYDFVMITALMDRTLPRVERVGNIEVHRMGVGIAMLDKILLALFGDWKARSLHKKMPFSCVWSLMASYCGFAAQRFASAKKIPFLLTLQEGDPIEYILHRVRFVRRWFNKIFTEATALQAISTYLLKWGKDMGFRGQLEEVVPNGVDVARFTAEHPEEGLALVRQSFGFCEDAKILVTASRLVKKNGVADVIMALPLLPKEVCFVICGSGELEAELRTLARSLGVMERVHFMGNQSHEVLPRILHASDIFIRPSLTEGLGNAFLEAMATGLPTIGTPAGGIPDFLKDGETGFICEIQDPESIAETVERILALSDKERAAVHARAMEIILQRYNWDYIVGRMKHFFDTLCK